MNLCYFKRGEIDGYVLWIKINCGDLNLWG